MFELKDISVKQLSKSKVTPLFKYWSWSGKAAATPAAGFTPLITKPSVSQQTRSIGKNEAGVGQENKKWLTCFIFYSDSYLTVMTVSSCIKEHLMIFFQLTHKIKQISHHTVYTVLVSKIKFSYWNGQQLAFK